MSDAHLKVEKGHLKRSAYLYVRQSTLTQVNRNTESTKRQYALRQRAEALGWHPDNIIVIDSDLGHSGASAADREGFQMLMAKVGLGEAGVVLSLEVSRLARNCVDWQRLIAVCALTDTLILDEDGLYDPKRFNDRLLLGLKGTMGEAELHIMMARLQGGLLNKARRGELKIPLPVGFLYTVEGEVSLDPDRQVQDSLRTLFRTFLRTESAWKTVREFRDQGHNFPRRIKKGPQKGTLVWGKITHSHVLNILHNPRYAGAYVYGRVRCRKNVAGEYAYRKVPQDEWLFLIRDLHAGYISWEEFEKNGEILKKNAAVYGGDRRKSPPREGPALLQGMVMCGLCGGRMTVRYAERKNSSVPIYLCQREGIEQGKKCCQNIVGGELDEEIGRILVEAVNPISLEVALTVHQELISRAEDADRLRRRQVERAQYETDLSRNRFMMVDPNNRLVADELEADWNEKIRILHGVKKTYDEKRREDHGTLAEEERKRIMGLASDFPRLWNDPKTPFREKKRMVRSLIADVTLVQSKDISINIRFTGGATRTFTIPRAKKRWELTETPPEIVQEIDRLLDRHPDGQIAAILNERGIRSGQGNSFHTRIVAGIRRRHGLRPRSDRLRDAGLLSTEEMAERLDVSASTLRTWRRNGLLQGILADGREYFYEPPGQDPPRKEQGARMAERRRFPSVATDRITEVQYAT